MVLADRLPAGRINVELHGHFVPYRATLHHTVMDDEVSSRLLRIRNLDFHTMLRRNGPPNVTDLSASFAVERCALEHQFHALPRMDLLDLLTIDNDGNQWARRLGEVVARKTRGPSALQDALIHGRHLHFPRALPGLAGFDARRFQFGLKLLPIKVETRFHCHFLGEINRKPKRVVQPKSLRPGNTPRAVLAVLVNEPIQLPQALMQRVQEALLLTQEHLADVLALCLQLRIGLAHDALHGVHQTIQEGFLESEHFAMPRGAPYDAA